MISLHTRQSMPVTSLLGLGALSVVNEANGEHSFRLDIPANEATGVGAVGSYWHAEPSDHPALDALGMACDVTIQRSQDPVWPKQ